MLPGHGGNRTSWTTKQALCTATTASATRWRTSATNRSTRRSSIAAPQTLVAGCPGVGMRASRTQGKEVVCRARSAPHRFPAPEQVDRLYERRPVVERHPPSGGGCRRTTAPRERPRLKSVQGLDDLPSRRCWPALRVGPMALSEDLGSACECRVRMCSSRRASELRAFQSISQPGILSFGEQPCRGANRPKVKEPEILWHPHGK